MATPSLNRPPRGLKELREPPDSRTLGKRPPRRLGTSSSSSSSSSSLFAAHGFDLNSARSSSPEERRSWSCRAQVAIIITSDHIRISSSFASLIHCETSQVALPVPPATPGHPRWWTAARARTTAAAAPSAPRASPRSRQTGAVVHSGNLIATNTRSSV